MDYEFNIVNPNFAQIGYLIAVANVNDKHDRSAPSDYHWKVLKCRMLIFSNSSILSCPDKQDLKRVHILFNKIGGDYDKLTMLFVKYSLTQDGPIRETTPEIYKMCFQYTMTAKLAPMWNTLGIKYLVNDRDFLTKTTPTEGIQYNINSDETGTIISLKAVKLNLRFMDKDFLPGELVRVLPSLNRAVLEDFCEDLSKGGDSVFKSYKDLRRHWKNIHGYRLPEENKSSYCLIRFWRGEPFTYPKICVTRNFPIVTPMPKSEATEVLNRFQNGLKYKMSYVLGFSLKIQDRMRFNHTMNESLFETQAISLCSQTQIRTEEKKS